MPIAAATNWVGSLDVTTSPRLWTGRWFLKEELSDDGLHVNAKGYAVMDPPAENAIRLALKARRVNFSEVFAGLLCRFVESLPPYG
jgi:lysophospholipase L1-like esterase